MLALTAWNRVRDLNRKGFLTAHDYRIAQELIFHCGLRWGASRMISRRRLASLCNVGLTAVQNALNRLRHYGIIGSRPTRVRIWWQGLLASRRGPNIWFLLSNPTEFASRPTVLKQGSKKERRPAKSSALTQALAALQKRIADKRGADPP